VQDLRAAFPIFEQLSYLNAGTSGPVPRAAVDAVAAELAADAERGRGDKAFFEDRFKDKLERLRAGVASPPRWP
jgi:selenocysteine lyase/cysteine desulfurase